MSKTICRTPEIILGGIDVSKIFVSANISIRYGDLNKVYLTLRNDRSYIQINRDDTRALAAINDKIWIKDVDVSSWVEAYSFVNHATYGRTVELTLHADRDVLSINGTYPWESV